MEREGKGREVLEGGEEVGRGGRGGVGGKGASGEQRGSDRGWRREGALLSTQAGDSIQVQHETRPA